MPLVSLQYKSRRRLEEIAGNLAKEMPRIVSGALDTPENKDGRLKPDDVEVWVGESREMDVNTKDIEIIIWANHYPERLANLDKRKEAILAEVRRFLADYDRDVHGYVWVMLNPAAFGEI